jgi:hypothetical protein
MKLGTIEMPLTGGILKMLTGMGVGAAGDEQGVVLRNLQVAVAASHRSNHESIVADGATVVRLDRDRSIQRNDRLIGSVRSAQHDTEWSGTGGYVERGRRIEGEANRTWCECHPRLKVDLAAIVEAGPQTPSHAADPDCSPQIHDRIMQPILEIVEMIGGYPQPIDELSVTIVSH